MEHVAHAAVGAQLLSEAMSAPGMRRPSAASHPLRRVGTGIAQPPEAEHLGADENRIAVGETMGLIDEEPGAVSLPRSRTRTWPPALMIWA